MFRVFRDQDRGWVLIDVVKRCKGAPDGILVVCLQFDRFYLLNSSFLLDSTTDALPSEVVNQKLEDVCGVVQRRIVARPTERQRQSVASGFPPQRIMFGAVRGEIDETVEEVVGTGGDGGAIRG